MFEEEGVVAGFCSGFCRACGLALDDMAAAGECLGRSVGVGEIVVAMRATNIQDGEKGFEGCIEVRGRKSGRPSWL
jgi:hypothetical protein